MGREAGVFRSHMFRRQPGHGRSPIPRPGLQGNGGSMSSPVSCLSFGQFLKRPSHCCGRRLGEGKEGCLTEWELAGRPPGSLSGLK